MAWTTPGTATAGEVLTAAFWNTQVRDNMTAVRDGTGLVPDMAGASRVAAQAISNSTWTFLSLDTEDFDTNTMFTATDTKITIKKAGVYVVSAFAAHASAGAGYRQLRIEKNAATASNGTNLANTNFTGNTPGSGEPAQLSLSRVVLLAANDTLHASVWQNSGGNLNCTGFLSVAYVGATA